MSQVRSSPVNDTKSVRLYSSGQRGFALLWGCLCHATFLIAITSMAVGLFTGMRLGRGSLDGTAAAFANLALILQFAVLHSILLSAKGRRWMASLPLPGIASELSTTTFALLSSLQILAVFMLWSPGDTLWFAPGGASLIIWSIVYAGAWLLLLKSMADSGLSLQTGSLGWKAVWQNRRPKFPGYAMRGLYRFSRQPIYVAFALILWTAPTWTPDHLLIAIVWTGYCLLGPVFKERRFLKFYADGYRHFADSVPYWLPSFGKGKIYQRPVCHSQTSPDFDIIIAGAGPIGMVLANLLGQGGHRVLVVEPRERLSTQSRSIGVTAPTLQTLDRIGILEACLQASVPIAEAKVFGDGVTPVGSLRFQHLDGSAPPVVSLPQCRLESLLEKAMSKCPTVTYRTGATVISHCDEPGRVNVEIANADTCPSSPLSCRWLVACDGANSPVRDQSRMPTRHKTYGSKFAMADFVDHSGFGDGVRLFFTAAGAVETFPLPEGRRRWVVQLSRPELNDLDEETLLREVQHRAKCTLAPQDRTSPWSRFAPRRLLCDRFFHGRTLLCGDAAHVMSPIGGHGMNVGIGDAIAAHACLHLLLNSGDANALRLLRGYDRKRRNAFVRSSRRAAIGMWMGTRTGRFASALRAFLLSQFLSSNPLRKGIANHFAMTSELQMQMQNALATDTPPTAKPLQSTAL